MRTGTLSQTQTYTYDNMDRLTGVCFELVGCSGGPGPSSPEVLDPFIRWTYDGVGNRLSEERPAGTTGYLYNGADELILVGGAARYTYDKNGNQRSGSSRTFTYDLANRLKTATEFPTTTTYSYDGEGKRLQASTGTQAAQKTNSLWDPNFMLPQLALEQDGAGALLRSYRYGHRRISMTAGTTSSFYHYDPLGSVVDITGGAGASRWTLSYEPFGKTRSEQQGAGTQPANLLKFTGEYADPTGLYHLRARQYDPGSGRFLTRDRLSPIASDPYVSAYAYVGNRPTLLIDPSGRFGISFCGHTEAAFGLFVSGKICVHAAVSGSGVGFGTSHTVSGGIGLKAGIDVGGAAGFSDARCIADYGGESYSGGVAVGFGGRGDITYQRGPNANGQQINELSVGASAGLAAAAGPHFERNSTTVDRSVGWTWGRNSCDVSPAVPRLALSPQSTLGRVGK